MPNAAGDGDDGDAPWHDQTLPIAERMKLAEGRPLRRRMMAAMAQQDCGQCGYNCNDYSDAIFDKSEERLNLCVPGGKETARMLKALYEEIGSAPAAAKAPAEAKPAAVPQPAGDAGRSRDNPALATFVAPLPAQQGRLREGDLASRVRSQRSAGSTMRSATPSACSRRTIRRSPMR